MSDFSERMRSLMSRRGESYESLSRSTGIPTSTLQRYATGEAKKVPVDAVQQIAKALRCPPVALAGWTPEPEQSKDPVDAKIDEALQKLSKLNAENRAQAEKYLDFLLATQDTK